MLDELRDLFLAALKFDGENAMPLVRDWNLAVKRVQESFDRLTDKDPNAVPVVRCKDCKYWNTNNYYHSCGLLNIVVNNGDFFCADGEREGGDE